MDITAAYNNEDFITPVFDVSSWAAAYVLSTAAWRLQIRINAADPVPLLDIPNLAGAVNFSANAVQFVAPISAIQLLVGSYVWEFGFTPVGGDFVRVDGGAATFFQGVVR